LSAISSGVQATYQVFLGYMEALQGSDCFYLMDPLEVL
jgi:hypothetical protein